jgi:hypothetical protein
MEDRWPKSDGPVRAAIACALLVAFWGAIGYTFWPEIVPGLLRVVQSARGLGAQEIESRYFYVRDRSSADQARIRTAVQTLEADYEAIQAYLGGSSGYPIPVLITDGPGPSLTDGTRLDLFYDGQAIDLGPAPFFLVLLWEGDLSLPDMNLFVQAGAAVHVVEEIGRARPLIGQSTDAWVALFRQRGTLLPLSEAWKVELAGDDLPQLLRASLESGSFMRWVADGYGREAVQDLRNGLSVEDVTGLSIDEAEQAWLASVAAKALHPQPCAQAVPERSFLHGFCGQLE